jgi:glutamine amidotransferase
VSEVVVVDYGAGNTRSVCAALGRLGKSTLVTSEPGRIRDAGFVVLPGVGSARSAMEHLGATGAAAALRRRFDEGGAILGICLGMQLAMAHSEEDGGVDGLALLEGDVVRLHESRVPRLGWSVVEPWGDAFYFAHSFAVRSPEAVASVDGVTVAVRRDDFLGVQFHPEKSGPAGLDFLDQCLSLA